MKIALNRRDVVFWGIAVESFLGLVFAVWAWSRGFSNQSVPLVSVMLMVLCFVIPLLGLNLAIFSFFARRLPAMRLCLRFVDEVVKPLADSLDWKSALLISFFAGCGEEAFFRGVLQNEFGITAASLLFALLHFGTAVREFFVVACLYFVIGLYFGAVYRYSATLWVPIGVHFVYDFAALLYLRYCYRNTT